MPDLAPDKDASPSPRRDFPYYRGEPCPISLTGWLIILAMTAAGFIALVARFPPVWTGDVARWGGIALFVLLPLAGLAVATGRHWKAIFRAPTPGDIGIGLSFGLLNIVVSGGVGWAVTQLMETAANPAVQNLAAASLTDRIVFFVATLPQLVGEELITILPFLALLALCHNAFRLPRLTCILAAWTGSSLIFAALHLPTYGWHIAQTVLIIGSARLVLTIPYLVTKNVWSSAIAHITNDWLLFVAVLLLSGTNRPA